MGKRGVHIFLFLTIAVVLMCTVFYFSGGFSLEKPIASISQVTGCVVGGYCGGVSEGEKTFQVVVPERLNAEFTNMYIWMEEEEFLLCLYGFLDGNTYELTGYSNPSYAEGKNGSLVYSHCDEDAFGTLHNHYNPSDDDYLCQLSMQDIYAFGQDGTDLMGIICGAERYVFVHKSIEPAEVLIG